MTPLPANLHMKLPILRKPSLLAFALILLAASSCNAPLVRSAGLAKIPVEEFADGTEELELDVGGGAHLRGVFTPAQIGIPRRGLAIHFLPAGASLTTGLEGGFTGVKQSLGLYAARGWDSVMLDHRGVGASTGKLSPEQLASDALAVWQQVHERTRPGELLVLRGVSLGSLSVAALLDAGVPADGVVLYAPVRSASVVDAAARQRYGAVFGGFVALFVRNPQVPDLMDQLSGPRKLLIVVPEDDYLLSASETTKLRELVEVQGGEFLELAESDHADAVLRAFSFELGEFSARHVDRLPAEEEAFLDGLTNR